MNDLLERIFTGAITLVLLGWIWVRSQGRADALEKRVLAIELAFEQSRLNREELLGFMARSTQERREMHEENQAWQREIRQLIEANEQKRSKTEHAILDSVNALKMKNAASEAVEKYRNQQNER